METNCYTTLGIYEGNSDLPKSDMSRLNYATKQEALRKKTMEKKFHEKFTRIFTLFSADFRAGEVPLDKVLAPGGEECEAVAPENDPILPSFQSQLLQIGNFKVWKK